METRQRRVRKQKNYKERGGTKFEKKRKRIEDMKVAKKIIGTSDQAKATKGEHTEH